MTSRKCLLLVMGVMCTFFATDIHAQEKVIQTLRKRLEGVVPPKQEEVYVVFARKTMDSMTRIENWQDLTNQQRDMIVRSTVKLARRWKSIFAKKGFAQASKKKERLRSLLKGWIGMVAIDLTQPIDTPMEKKARKEVFSELADTLTHAKKLGRAGKKVTRKEMSPLQRKTWDLFLEFTKLSLTSGHQSWSRQVRDKYRDFLQEDSRHAQKVNALVAKLDEKINGTAQQGKNSGEAYALRFLLRARYLMSFLRKDVIQSGGELTSKNRRELRTLIEDSLQKLKAIGAFEKTASVQQGEIKKLDSVERAMLNYIEKARGENPVLENIAKNLKSQTLRSAYHRYVENSRDEAEAQYYRQLRKRLIEEVGKPNRSEIAYRRAKYLAKRLKGEVYMQHRELKKKAATARRGGISVDMALRHLKEAGFFDGPGRMDGENLTTDDGLARLLAEYLSACRTHDHPILNLNREFTDLELSKLYEKHQKEMSQAERNAAKKFKASLLKQIRAAR